MVTSHADVEQEIVDLIREKLDLRTEADPTWLTQEIVGRHPKIFGDDRDWALVCIYADIRNTVRRVLRDYKGDERTPEQLRLPGYERLQKGYLVERDGEQRIVPTPDLTDAELDAKADELEEMARGCIAHADELRRYKHNRLSLSED